MKKNNPKKYARYADDIFFEIKSEEQLLRIKETMVYIPVLKFTYEISLK